MKYKLKLKIINTDFQIPHTQIPLTFPHIFHQLFTIRKCLRHQFAIIMLRTIIKLHRVEINLKFCKNEKQGKKQKMLAYTTY